MKPAVLASVVVHLSTEPLPLFSLAFVRTGRSVTSGARAQASEGLVSLDRLE
jgi:hypothetical protein